MPPLKTLYIPGGGGQHVRMLEEAGVSPLELQESSGTQPLVLTKSLNLLLLLSGIALQEQVAF